MDDEARIQRRSVLGGAVALGAAAGIGTVNASAAAAAAPPSARGRDEGRDRVVLITGCSSGFGRLTAITLARRGYRVYASMRDTRWRNHRAARELRTLARRERLELDVVDIDVRDDRSVGEGVRWVHRREGRIDVLVNNAGMFYPALVETLTVADVQGVFDTNLFGALRMNRAVLPIMRDAREGLVVQMTTALARFVFPFLGAYCGSKYALEAMTEVTRYEVSDFGIDVTMVEPGAYSTDFADPNGAAYYRRYLRRLGPRDARRREEYGELARRVESQLVEDSDADPQEIADAIAGVVRMPRGQRPVRVLGPGMEEMIGSLDEVARDTQRTIMEAAGFGDLLTVEHT